MTDNIQRQPKGVPVGGQFASVSHAEPALSITARRPELNGWPESLPEPEVEFEGITTTVSINGERVVEVWNPADDIHDTETESFEDALAGLNGIAQLYTGVLDRYLRNS